MSKTEHRQTANEVSTDDETPSIVEQFDEPLTDGVERDEWNVSEQNTVFFEEDEDLFMLVHDSFDYIEGTANTINLTEYSEPTEAYTARLMDSDVAERVLVVESNGQTHTVNLSLYRELCEQAGVDWQNPELLMADMYGAHPVGVRINNDWVMYIAPIINVGIESGSKEEL